MIFPVTLDWRIARVNGFDGIIKQLEAQKAAIERALEALREVGGESPGASAPAPVSPGGKRSAGQKARWAAAKNAETPVPAKATRKGGMTPEGRKRLADAMKKRWVVKRTAAQAKKRGPKKAA
jgi:hypothetical protein